MKKPRQIASGKNFGALIQMKSDFPDTLENWLSAYFRFEVTTSIGHPALGRPDSVNAELKILQNCRFKNGDLEIRAYLCILGWR